MIHTGCDPSIFSFSHWNTSVIFFSKKHHILTSWVIQALFKEVGFYLYVLFFWYSYIWKPWKFEHLGRHPRHIISLSHSFWIYSRCTFIGQIHRTLTAGSKRFTIKGSNGRSGIWRVELKRIGCYIDVIYLKVTWQGMNLVRTRDDESCQEWNYLLFQNLLLPAHINATTFDWL